MTEEEKLPPPGIAPQSASAPPDEERADDAAAQEAQTSDLQILAKLGRGSQAVVHKCRQVSLDRIVAVKFLSASAAGDDESCRRFIQEARDAAVLRHANIVTIHEIRPFKNTFYIVMEFLDGGSVADLLAAQSRLEPGPAVVIIRQAAEALRYAHARGFVHRDIKPRNILLTAEGLAKLADMGIACHEAAVATRSGQQWKAYGTPYYMSPEQVTGDPPPDFRTDFYSLGAALYEMVTGRPPFTAPTPQEIMRKHVIEPLPDPRALAPDLPEGLCGFLAKAMAKEPEDRYQSAADFIGALDRLGYTEAKEPEPFSEYDPVGVLIGPVVDPNATAPEALVQSIADLAEAERRRPRRVEAMLTQGNREQGTGNRNKRTERRPAGLPVHRSRLPVPAFSSPAPPAPQEAKRRASRQRTLLICFGLFVVASVVAGAAFVWHYRKPVTQDTRSLARPPVVAPATSGTGVPVAPIDQPQGGQKP